MAPRLTWPVAAVAALVVLLAAACGGSGVDPGAASAGPGTSGTTHSAPAAGASSGPVTPPSTSSPATTLPATPRATTPVSSELPRGGRTLFPHYRLVGFAGHPNSVPLGRLGIGKLADRTAEIEKLAERYADGRTPLPVLELIATVVQAQPGRDGMYRARASDSMIATQLAAARQVNGILLLGIQPGRSPFLTEVKAYAKWLKEPDVGIALDPEWAMGPRQVPMRVFGSTTGKEINGIAAYLAGVVEENDLPEKVLVFHQLAPSIVRHESDIKAHPGVAIIKSVDGIGSRAMKEETWRKLTATMPKSLYPGFKLFYEEDAQFGPLMTPAQVLALRPEPDYVLYE